MSRILIIEDEEGIRLLVKLALEMNANWQVITASSGEEGITLAATEVPDAILLDVMMPGIDGFATFKQLQANSITASIPVILLTTKFQTTEPNRLSQLGIKGIIPKPFDPITLETDIDQILAENK
ncbi:response regulator [Pleurocapsales cyanobacterium LEGE 10410]|nr:response regulator [Pleurocapsales cyanobacterium LEGE 10410]